MDPTSPECPTTSPECPRYAAETHRQRSAAHQERRMHGDAIRQMTDQQKLDARRKVRDMLRGKSRKACSQRYKHEQMMSAIDRANAAYTKHARQCASELRALTEDCRSAKEQLAKARHQQAQAVRSHKEVEVEIRSEATAAKASLAKRVHDQIWRGTHRSSIPPEMLAQMQRLGVGPFASPGLSRNPAALCPYQNAQIAALAAMDGDLSDDWEDGDLNTS